MKLNLGCGNQVVDGWVNVDYALGARFTRIPLVGTLSRKLQLFDLDWHNNIYLHDLTKRFPWGDESVDIVYSSHTLEHFTRAEGRSFLSESHRVLRKKGIIRIVVPCLQRIVEEYTTGKVRADEFVEKLGVLYGNNRNKIKNTLAHFIQFPHKCMYDTPTLLMILEEIGFNAISREPFNSDIDDIRQIETEERTTNAVIMEGRKK